MTFTVDELADSLEAHEQRKKKKEETLDQALQTKASIKDEKVLYSQVKAAEMKEIIRRRDSRAKQIGVEENAVKDIIPTFSAINVKTTVTMRMIVTPTNVMAEWGMLQKIVEPKKGWKRQRSRVPIQRDAKD